MHSLLLLTNSIPGYRVKIFNDLGGIFDLTICHYGERIEEEVNFKQCILHPIEIGPFTIFKENIYKISNSFDSVIAMGSMKVLPFILLGMKRHRKFSLTFWGGDVSFSYTKRYDEDRRLDKIRFYLSNKADSIVFYSRYPVARYISDGKVSPKKLFVANNTVYIKKRVKIPLNKSYFLFVGTLYRSKKIFDLLEAYLMALSKNKAIPKLIIVGGGSEADLVEEWVVSNSLESKVELLGPIYDEKTLERVFVSAIACISPGQAGLSVLTSFAYGVPFITTANAYTGGERFNIIDNYNGYLYDGEISTLSDLLVKLSNNSALVNEMSRNAQNYFFDEASPDKMVKSLVESVKYAMLIKKGIR